MADITHILGGDWQPKEKQYDPPEIQLLNAIIDSGIQPGLDHVTIDGNIHRFNTGDRKGKTGWYVAFADGVPAGKFGCWRQDIEQTWRAETGRELSAADQMAHTRRMAEAKRKREEARQAAYEITEDVVSQIWEQAQPAEDDHPYLKRKGVQAHGARVTGDGRLVVPLYDADDALISLQYINHEGDKLYHARGKTKGGYWLIGDIEAGGEVYIAEGFATAATIHEQTGQPCAIAYSASNLPMVAGIIKDKIGDASRIIIVADNDEGGVGQKYADQACALHGCRYVMPPEDGDANDWVQAGGDINDIIGQPAYEWLEWMTPGWANEPKPIKWLIKNWIPEACLGMLHGPSGSGKTWVMLDMLLHVATSQQWNGQKTKPGCIVYLAGEGNYGIRIRAVAWMQEHGGDYEQAKFLVSKSGCDLNTRDGYNQAMQYITQVSQSHTIKAICVDTLHRFLHGDENSAEDAKTMIDACDALKRHFEASVWLVHHTGLSENAQDRARGSSAWRGALDVEIGLRPPQDTKPGCIIQHKMKDAEAAMPQQFELRTVPIAGWKDEDGEQVNCAVVDWMGEYDPPEKDTPLSKAVKAYGAAWSHLCAERDSQGRPQVSAQSWHDYLVKTGMNNTTARNKTRPSGSTQSHWLSHLINTGKVVEGDITGMYAFVGDDNLGGYESGSHLEK